MKRHWYVFIINQSCGRQFFIERYCYKKDLEYVIMTLSRNYDASTIRYFRRGKNHFENFIEGKVIE